MSKVYITLQLNSKNSTIPTISLANLHETNAYNEFMTLDEERKTYNYEDYTFTLERIWTNQKYRNIRLLTNANEFLISDNNQELVDSLNIMAKIMHKNLMIKQLSTFDNVEK
jgi:aminoglycoside phosphotransferase family enzyme